MQSAIGNFTVDTWLLFVHSSFVHQISTEHSLKKIYLFVCLCNRKREKESMRWGAAGRGRGRSRLPDERLDPRTWDYDLSQRQTPNQLSRPGAPSTEHFYVQVTVLRRWSSWIEESRVLQEHQIEDKISTRDQDMLFRLKHERELGSGQWGAGRTCRSTQERDNLEKSLGEEKVKRCKQWSS